MSKSLHEKLLKFVEEEKKEAINDDLLGQLHEFAAMDTMYWEMSPIERNTFNRFFKEMHSALDAELVAGKYGASVCVDATIVSVFETGFRLGAISKSGSLIP
jgi:hypothetical protein